MSSVLLRRDSSSSQDVIFFSFSGIVGVPPTVPTEVRSPEGLFITRRSEVLRKGVLKSPYLLS